MRASYPELFQRYSGNPILTVENWAYPANSVFNCGATTVNGETVLLARVEDLRGLSHLTVARSKDGISNWKIDPQPTFLPDPEYYPEELWGIEDPRITFIDSFRNILSPIRRIHAAGRGCITAAQTAALPWQPPI